MLVNNGDPMTTAPSSSYVVPPLRERLGRAGRALVNLAVDPNRLEQVFVIDEALNAARIPAMLEKLERDPETRRLLAERPRIDSAHVDFDALERLPDGTLGREYIRFLRDNDITPDVFQMPELGDERMAYAVMRMRQTHDLWHVLTGYAPDVTGEVLLQAFTFVQLRAPSALAITAMGTVRFGWRTPGFFRRLRAAVRGGRATKKLAAFRWEEHWAEPVEKLRQDLGCPAASLS
jgi:ubiquinone biosynthesis protein COQ4